MNSSRSLTLFGNSTTEKTVATEKLPVLNEAQKNNLFAGKTIDFRYSYLYDMSRPKRHYDAQVFIHSLYNTGATLVNTGLAYTADSDLKLIDSDGIDKCGTDTAQSKPAQASNHALCARLMEKYHSLPDCVIWNGSHPANNPFQALFVIKIALDHLPPEAIYQWYVHLKKQALEMTILPSPITFPNGSQFLGDHSSWQVLRCYIANNIDAKFGMIKEPDKSRILSTDNYFDSMYFDLVGKDAMELKPLLNDLFKQNMPLMASAETPAIEQRKTSSALDKPLDDYTLCRIS